MAPIRNLLLDWSGTLANDLSAVLVATNGILAHHQLPALSREEFQAKFRLPYTEFYRAMLPDVPLSEMKELYVRHFPQGTHPVPMLPHAKELLEFAAASGRPRVLLSSVPREHFEVQAEAAGVRHLFSAVYCDVVDKRETIAGILQAEGLDPKETAFIGDMRHDIEAGHTAGVFTIATSTGYESPSTLLEARPDLLVPNLSRLPGLLGPLPPASSSISRSPYPVATVGALLFNTRGEVLLVKTHKWSDLWGIPGGKIKRGESSLDALRREIREETGLEISGIRFVMVQDCIDPPEFMQPAHFLLLNYVAQVEGEKPQVQLNDEAEEFRWLTVESAFQTQMNTPTRILMEECMRQQLIPTPL